MDNKNTLALFGFDFETTGVNPLMDQPVQAGLIMRLFSSPDTSTDYPLLNMLCKPDRLIYPGASQVHGITDAMVQGEPPVKDVLEYLAALVAYHATGRKGYLVSYNGSRFDLPMLNTILGRQAVDLPHIDVLRFILRYFPESKGLDGGKTLGEMHLLFLRRPLGKAHDATSDITGTLDLLRFLQAKAGVTLQRIAEEQQMARPYTVMPIGKYRGLPISEVPKSWAAFMSNKDLDPDLRATVDCILER